MKILNNYKKNLRNLTAQVCGFGLKTNGDWNLLRKFRNLHLKISIENWLFLPFLSDLPGHLSFYTVMENNPIFLQQFLRFRGYCHLPPAGAPENILTKILTYKYEFKDLSHNWNVFERVYEGVFKSNLPLLGRSHRRRQADTGTIPSPRKGEKCGRKMKLFPASVLATIFP